jgi:hypothetical protein
MVASASLGEADWRRINGVKIGSIAYTSRAVRLARLAGATRVARMGWCEL